MKRIGILLLAAVLILTGCAEAPAQRNPDWDESWVTVGDLLAIEPLEGFTLNESNDVLSISGLYYTTLTCGEGQSFVRDDGKEATVYDAQIYILLKACADAEEAAQEIDGWITREQQAYTSGDLESLTVGAQAYQILPLINGQASNPYPSGTAAFAVQGQNAISVELVCSERFSGDTHALMEQLLSGFHYAGEQEA